MAEIREAATAEAPAAAWEAHRRSCWRCRRQWRKWEAGEMTCEQGVDLLFATINTQGEELTLF